MARAAADSAAFCGEGALFAVLLVAASAEEGAFVAAVFVFFFALDGRTAVAFEGVSDVLRECAIPGAGDGAPEGGFDAEAEDMDEMLLLLAVGRMYMWPSADAAGDGDGDEVAAGLGLPSRPSIFTA